MQVFAQKSVLVVSICFPLIALINTDISCFRANPCTSVGHHISLRSAQKSQLSKPIFLSAAGVLIAAQYCRHCRLHKPSSLSLVWIV